MQHLPLHGNAHELSALIERMVLTAPHGREITSGDIETLVLRQKPTANLTDVWEGCRLDEEVRLFEGKLIRQALEASNGQITRAARLLGVTHQCLAYILQGRHRELLKVRTPVQRRRRSIILKSQAEREKEKKA
jgi:transcriptional regulator with PAS, ATPase and Fis domain